MRSQTSCVIACTDAHYVEQLAAGAAVLALHVEDRAPVQVLTAIRSAPAPYTPGAFFERELPLLRAVLDLVQAPLEAVIVDGHAWLAPNVPGLGAHLFEALGRRVPVIGIAKSAYRGSVNAQRVVRGQSTRPLFVTAAGMDAIAAAELVRRMAGEHRIPSLSQQADAAARAAIRDTAAPSAG